MRRNLTPALLGLALLGSSALLSACNPHAQRARAYRRNPSPEVTTLYERDADVKNALSITFDENLRMAKQDLGRFFYTDRPSRLTREPIPRP
jgi:hypothetical protein